MSLKVFTIDFKELAKSNSVRLWLPFELPKINYPYEKVNNFLELCEAGNRPKGGISNDFEGEAVSLGGKQIGVNGSVNLSKIPFVSSEFYKNAVKGKVKDNDILICKDGALTGKTCLVDFSVFPNNQVMVNEHVFILRGNEKINQNFLFYLTRNDIFQSQVKDLAYRKKAQPGLNFDHFKKIKIPLISKEKQDEIVSKIEPIEKEIEKLKSEIKEPQEIINKVFAKEFDFDLNLHNDLGKGMTAGTQKSENRKLKTFQVDFKDFFRSSILRCSTRFHNTPTKKLMDILDSIKTLKVKNIIKSYEKGIQPKYNSDGEIPVVKIANLKNGFIDFSNPEFITQEFFNDLNNSKKLKKNDVIICATGKISLGKIDFYDYKNESITSVDNYILRLKEKYNPLFFTYFFRSILGYFQIERDFTGATNQIHLYWDQISNFKIPDISLSQQQKITKKIKTQLDQQQNTKQQIKTQRNKIDQIIEKVIK